MRKLTAILTAAMLCTAAAPIQIHAEDTLPENVPQSFAQAMRFTNNFGATNTQDGYVILVQQEEQNNDYMTYAYTYEAVQADGSVLAPMFEETYTFTIPEEPDASDEAAYAAYLQELETLGVSFAYTGYTKTDGLNANHQYRVAVYQPVQALSLTVNMVQTNKYGTKWESSKAYTFDISEDGTVTQTDLYGFIPDCMEEFYAYREENGLLSAKNGYAVYASDVTYDGGFSVSWKQEGTGSILNTVTEELSYHTLEVSTPGTMGHEIDIFAPETPGIVRLEVWSAQEWEPEVRTNEAVIWLRIGEDMTMEQITEEEAAAENTAQPNVSGDVDGDGAVTVADAVMFTRYLHGSMALAHPENGDLNGDGCVDIFDLSLTKRELTEMTADAPAQEGIPFTQIGNDFLVGSYEENHDFSVECIDSPEKLAEICQKEYTEMPEGITDDTFTDKLLLALYTPNGGCNAYQDLKIQSITRAGDTLTITSTNDFPEMADPAYSPRRFLLLVNRSDISDVTEFMVQNTNTVIAGKY